MFNFAHPTKQKAFTLVELLTVMVVLVALATITVKSTAQFSFDSRYQITEDRYDKIKTAILGNPNQTINGHPSVSGFVADMGRLPNCLQELIIGYCGTTVISTTWTTDVSTCSDATKLTHVDCANVSGAWWNYKTGLGYGWRSAYIEISNNPTNSNAFADGWGRKAEYICHDTSTPPVQTIDTDQISCTNHVGYTWDAVTTDDNYGWYFNNNTTTNNLMVLSYGKDGLLDTVTPNADAYDNDYPQNLAPTISSNTWQSNEPAVTIKGELGSCSIMGNSTQATCTTAGGSWTPTTSCRLLSQSACATAGKTWNPATTTPSCSNGTSTKEIDCVIAGEIWIPPKEGFCTLTATTSTACTVLGGTFSPCLDLNYRKGDGTIEQKIIGNASISTTSATFTLPVATNLPMGQAAFRITDCIGGIYPTTHSHDYNIVDIFPNRSLNFDW